MSHKTGDDIPRDAKNRIREIAPAEVKAMIERGDKVVYLDVREPKEYHLGHLPNAVLVPRGSLELRVEVVVPRGAKVVVYCSAGVRSAMAAATLQAMGYTDVVSMAGGLREYVPTGGPVEG
jgi:rhodanese-related sulfurtransferase